LPRLGEPKISRTSGTASALRLAHAVERTQKARCRIRIVPDRDALVGDDAEKVLGG
jgi:hypothetical protein